MIPRAAIRRSEPWAETWALTRDRTRGGSPGIIAPATHFRSTWILASIETLRERGHYVRYRQLVPPSQADAILRAWAGIWMPLDVARAHYEACDALALSRAEQFAMGLAVNERARASVLRFAVRAARGVGANPWSILPHMHRLWACAADGGTITVRKLGPKDARLVVDGCALFDVPYFSCAFAGVALGVVRLFAERAYVHLETSGVVRGRCSLRFQWA